jgi:cytochrome o ubiquinol oxidase subunit 1
VVGQIDAYWQQKCAPAGRDAPQGTLGDLYVPRNTPIGVFLGFFAVVVGFALIWRISWLAAIGTVGAIIVVLRQSWSADREIRVPAEQVAAVEHSHAAAASAHAAELAVRAGSQVGSMGRV